ncbi:hypothetical protein [Sphingobacterium populi]|uniref:hypothetical protein n=1 Tax=Sphingobacterium sp. CFCC 11742 TaxID=1775560 RepID=UPI001E525B5A|nr:hypothetical protein [Sphingobacterium sp. CFCC 11742]
MENKSPPNNKSSMLNVLTNREANSIKIKTTNDISAVFRMIAIFSDFSIIRLQQRITENVLFFDLAEIFLVAALEKHYEEPD